VSRERERPEPDGDRAELAELLDVDPAGGPLRPVWPAVRDGLSRRRPWRLDPFLAFGAPATAAAGLVIGLLVGGGPPSDPIRASADDSEDVVLAFAAEEGTTLAEIWIDSWSPGEDTSEVAP
jgi:hypothetical protein